MAIDEMANRPPDEDIAEPAASTEVSDPVDSSDDEDKTQFKDDTYDTAPRGIMAFLALMLLFYIVYWFLIWFEVIIGRGA